MSFSTDRDLLALEPALFSEVLFASQKRVELSDGVIAGTTLTSATANFESAQVDAGDVLLIADKPCEVVARNSATSLTISQLRDHISDDALPPGDGSSLAVVHRTFAPQAELIHDELLRLLGIDAEGHSTLTEDAIVSLSVMRDLGVLLTLARLYEAATTISNEDSFNLLRTKATSYRARFREAARSSVIHLDLDGDGHADTVRDLRSIGLVRV